MLEPTGFQGLLYHGHGVARQDCQLPPVVVQFLQQLGRALHHRGLAGIVKLQLVELLPQRCRLGCGHRMQGFENWRLRCQSELTADVFEIVCANGQRTVEIEYPVVALLYQVRVRHRR